MLSNFSLDAHHVGVIVPDLEAAMHAYASNFDITFSVFEVDETSSTLTNASRSFNLRIAFGQVSLTAVELIQPVSGQTIHAEFLRQNGPGVHHLGFYVEDLEAAKNRLERRGYSLLAAGEIKNLGAFAYYRATDLHCVVEPLQLSVGLPLFLAEHATLRVATK
jgi:methylmalonyl-CoA/ethylmalonyl-CoA epimerase